MSEARAVDPDRRILAAGASLSLLGIGLSATGSQSVGSWLTVGALLVMLFALHRLGRQGPDEVLDFRKAERRDRKRAKHSSAATSD